MIRIMTFNHDLRVKVSYTVWTYNATSPSKHRRTAKGKKKAGSHVRRSSK